MKLPRWAWILLSLAIALLILLLLAMAGIQRRVEKIDAADTLSQLKDSIRAFHYEYREYPLLDPANDLTVDSGHSLMDILLASGPRAEAGGRNRRHIRFYSGSIAKPMADGRYRRGISVSKGGGELWDSWGQLYRVRFDSNGDGRIDAPDAPGTFLSETIAVWSAGPDGDFDTWADNPKSW